MQILTNKCSNTVCGAKNKTAFINNAVLLRQKKKQKQFCENSIQFSAGPQPLTLQTLCSECLRNEKISHYISDLWQNKMKGPIQKRCAAVFPCSNIGYLLRFKVGPCMNSQPCF